MRTLSEYFLLYFWSSSSCKGLLDETDEDLLKEHFYADQSRIPWFGLEVLAITTACLTCTTKFDHSICFLALLFIASIVLVLPLAICWLWNDRVDREFRNFITFLRRKELCLFSASKVTDTLLLPNRQARSRCIKQLRNIVRAFYQSSLYLISIPDAEKLLFNFIGDEMRILVSEPANGNDGNIDEADLQTVALKAGQKIILAHLNLWQFMFLIRSEFVRIFLISSLHHINECRPLAFLYNIGVILQIILRTCWLCLLDTPNWKSSAKTRRKPERHKEITSLTVCKTQLEWALERLEEIEENSEITNEWPPNKQFSADIITCLYQVIFALKSQKTDEPNAVEKLDKKNEMDNNGEEMVQMDKQQQRSEGTTGDYQIFEFDLSKSYSDQQMEGMQDNLDECYIKDELVNIRCSCDGNKIIHELKYAIEQRKDHCLKLEVQALARLRGVVPEEIARAELDRVPFSSKFTIKPEVHQKAMNPEPISRSSNSSIELNSHDFQSILAHRKSLFENAHLLNLVHQFGDEGDEEMNVE